MSSGSAQICLKLKERTVTQGWVSCPELEIHLTGVVRLLNILSMLGGGVWGKPKAKLIQATSKGG